MDTTPRYPGENLPPDAMTIDHIKSKMKGGTDNHGNLVLACYACNSLKADRTLKEFELVRVGLQTEFSKN